MLSVIVPIFNEENNKILARNLALLKNYPMIQIILSDGASTDKTHNIFREYEIIVESNTSRAARINRGVEKAIFDNILILHPRTLISSEAIEFLLSYDFSNWGGFTHSFDISHYLLRFTSWYSNHIRARFPGILYLDHCYFLKKDLFDKVGGMEEVDIFEDTLFSYKLIKAQGMPFIAPIKVYTSAIRFTQKGIYKQALINQYLKLRFHFSFDHKKLNKEYEQSLNLNSKYK